MLRMGHDSMRAALIDQHATQNADRYIADALAAAIEAEQLAMEDEDQASEDDYAAEGE
jgi:hypothetical protein